MPEPTKKLPLFYDLDEIAGWQLNYRNSTVDLPPMQRGFVWKVNQIEALWDSILRGFPIGSFLLSKSNDERFFLLDGQQRATSVALGYFNPWKIPDSDYNFWSVKKTPVVWIDLMPSECTNTQKFVIRVVTQSHPWGYQRKENGLPLSVADRRNALGYFREDKHNKNGYYIQLSPLKVYPYDSNLPVPLSFLIDSITHFSEDWKSTLFDNCKQNLPVCLNTKYESDPQNSYIERLSRFLSDVTENNEIYQAIKTLKELQIPAIVVSQEILKSEDEQTGEDPTLFVRLNSSGTRIAGDELIYSIYKASFPEAKDLVESIGASFISPAQVISLVARLAWSELNGGNYPYPINVNDFRRRIQEPHFKNKLKDYVGNTCESPAALLFKRAFDLLQAQHTLELPPTLVKNLIKNSPDLFLLLLQWLNINKNEVSYPLIKAILASLTALAWFGRDNVKYVRQIWPQISNDLFWTHQSLSSGFLFNNEAIMYPMPPPDSLRRFLLHEVAVKGTKWNDLYDMPGGQIANIYRDFFNGKVPEEEIDGLVVSCWDNFRNKLFYCRPMLLFAQRAYVNQNFGAFNQMDSLEDTNTPWDWDHIYPSSWVYRNWNIDPNTRHWSNSIGNLRVLSLEENRSESDSLSPKIRLQNVKPESFIKANDWKYWCTIEARIKEGDTVMICEHLNAVINRLCNIYEEWYNSLSISKLF